MISNSIYFGSTLLFSIKFIVSITKSASLTCTIDKFTEKRRGGNPFLTSLLCSLSDCSKTQSPTSWINPVCSKIGINISGLIRLFSSKFHLSNASTPAVFPVLLLIWGWNSKENSPFSKAVKILLVSKVFSAIRFFNCSEQKTTLSSEFLAA